ncbi:replication-associated recombination protein A [Companilactobacillus sp.]|uniref:replication-associated recombination protein A n=1 Tax=Companilactobacillus sp. TaxID=2767905 RepID=UPI0025C1896D|nr:replication-associated recombination protein A [Companilactobacillus sp.]MCH4008467.1 replication-associated recombination protein A [Companilactobacillus sp.]MCH4051354.1 replication-associated recombination protein A [Companilactobacillus sp.]MCH4076410.1 replication-associated recombination protein A [Companilactobacillus sp.]MCH4124985.1 replication-associated recombination protein A [Companilactobacillus sp.]MCH4131527.1 replication-associated recombination protein A [Companilactobacil
MQKPLAYRMRPTNIDEVVGQQHLVGKDKIIRRMVQAKMLSSMILYGPPGIGKTSIASAIAGSTKYAFRMLNAATDSKKDLQIVAEEAKMSGTVVLLLDEIHRLDKTKQDFLLPLLESGSIILIGATTENPYINISPAIRSRVQIFELKPLEPADLKIAVERALHDKEKGLGKYDVKIDDNAMDLLVSSTNGDLRSILNGLELSVLSTEPEENGQIHITLKVIEESVQKKAISADKNGDSHYDVISAFQKSIRGSDPDAALLYLARLLEAGELTTAIRRLIVCAYEDVGLANPQACSRAVQAAQVAQMVGLPEARIPLADAVIDLCLCPKSDTGIVAIDAALDDVRSGKATSIPDDLKDAHYKGAAKLGHGVGYKYPHNYPNDWVEQQYLPNNLVNRTYYQPKTTGKYEQALKMRLEQINGLKKNTKRS